MAGAARPLGPRILPRGRLAQHDLVAPLLLAWYSAASARCTASSKSSPARTVATPMVTVTCSTLPEPHPERGGDNGLVQALCQVAGPCGGVSGNRIRNSSPPQRQIVSVDRVTPARGGKNPAAPGLLRGGPWVSLMRLKWSRSHSSRARGGSLLLLCHFAAPHVHQAAAVHGASGGSVDASLASAACAWVTTFSSRARGR